MPALHPVPRTLAAVAVALATLHPVPAAAWRSSGVTTHTSAGRAVRVTQAPATTWASVPRPYALGTYSTRMTALRGDSPSRTAGVAALRHCNPFAGVRATSALAMCN